MNPFVLDPRSRLSAWKELRTQIQAVEFLDDKVQLTLTFWKQAPIENPILDWDNSSRWPTPWELLNNNRFCESTLSLAVAMTLVMSEPSLFEDIELLLITDRRHHVQKVVARLPECVLNYGWLDIHPRDILQGCSLHRLWTYDGRQWAETQPNQNN